MSNVDEIPKSSLNLPLDETDKAATFRYNVNNGQQFLE